MDNELVALFAAGYTQFMKDLQTDPAILIAKMKERQARDLQASGALTDHLRKLFNAEF